MQILNPVDRLKPHPAPKPPRQLSVRAATPPPTGPEPAGYTLAEAAWMLRVSPQWYREQLRKAKLPGSKFPNGWRLTRADIDGALAMRHMPATNGRNTMGMSERSYRRLITPKSLGGLA